jgi:hypothetical protein
VVGHAGGHVGMGQLEKECPRPGSEEEHRLAIESPGLARRAVQTRELIGCRAETRPDADAGRRDAA